MNIKTPKKYISKLDANIFVMVSDIISLAQSENHIGLIKAYRSISQEGLKDSKDKMDACRHFKTSPSNGYSTTSNYAYDMPVLHNTFEAVSRTYIFTKEEFMNVIGDAIDNMDKFHCDNMLEAVEFLFKNIKTRGGLEKLAMDREDFLEKI